MPLFIKTEQFTQKTIDLPPKLRNDFLNKHKVWVQEVRASGKKICSGYLRDKNLAPGGGGFLIFEANSFEEAKFLVEKDPMIKNNLVSWNLHEWVSVAGNLSIYLTRVSFH